MNSKLTILILLFSAGCLLSQDRPNVLLIISDDAGYADFGFTGQSDVIRTPFLDKLASEGVVFDQGYVTASVCAPSRMGLMTGRYQQRFGAECNVPVIPTPGFTEKDLGLDSAQKTMGDVMAAAGYRTFMIGKWHLGEREQYHPLDRGFDEFFGFLGGSRSYRGLKNPPPGRMLYRNREPVKEAAVTYLTDDLTDAAMDFIDRGGKDPFFVYLSYNAVHTPMEAKTEDIEQRSDISDERRRVYAAMTKSMDENIGRLMAHLADRGLEKNTLVVFVNDNGGARNNASENLPLRGFKGTYWEGGIRVPLIMRWPEKLKAGSRYNFPVSTLDLLPTFRAAAGLTSGESGLDGRNLLPHITGERSEGPHEYLFWRMWRVAVVRNGPWKLIRIAEDPLQKERKLLAPLILINLENDPDEKTNVAGRFPDVATGLQEQLDIWESGLAQPRWYDGSRWRHWADMQVKNHRMAQDVPGQ